ncbi:zonadhesin [Eublepharis macularius]|uniref:Zonadhesin n=1 Tax=Eublepharis macularius TaxID=481883 RepID=A0AA97LD31_EUBMA|nr:zonadhesin [Eublepharis macularius]
MAHLLALLLGLQAVVTAHRARNRSFGASELLGFEPSPQLLATPSPANTALPASPAGPRQPPVPAHPLAALLQAGPAYRSSRAKGRESCVISGDPHYTTFDGYLFHFMGTCTYLLSAVCHSTPDLPTFRIEETNAYRGDNKHVSYVQSVTVEVNGTQIVLLKGRRVIVDGQRVQLPVAVADGQVSVRLSGFSVLVQTNFGLRVRFDGNHYAEVSVPWAYSGRLCGLCGNYNGEKSDDNLMPNGTSAGSSANRLGESWQVPGAGDPRCTNAGEPWECDRSIATEAESPTNCGSLTDPKGVFARCHSQVPPEGAFESCVYDFCGTGGDPISLCFALQSYAERCAQAGVNIFWRIYFFCYPNCPLNSRYRSCGPACPATCLDPTAQDSCPNLPCVEGCVCKTGHLLSGDRCVLPSQCGCTDPSGHYHLAGESWMENDNCTRRCTCAGPHNITCEAWSCSPVQECRPLEGLPGCHDTGPATCQVSGDPHYFTFDGAMVSFMGTCTYTLVTVCHSNPRLRSFTITGRNEARGPSEASFLRQVNVEVAGANITLQKGRRVLLNSRRVRTPVDGQVPGVTVTTSGIFVTLETSFGLVVKFDGNHLVAIQLPGTYFGKVCGLCGNFNNQSQDDLLMPDGQMAANASQFGNSWKVPGDSDPSCQPDNRQDMDPSCSPQQMDRLRTSCREILAPKFRPCHAILDPLPFLQNCLYDMCQYQGISSVLCQSIQAYVEACQARGVGGLSWRNSTFCSPSCPPFSHYVECASPCPSTCLDLFAPLSCPSATTCVEGCACDQAFVLSDDRCVLTEDCGCQDTSSDYYSDQESWLSQDCQELCTCHGVLMSCVSFHCLPGSRCALSTAGLHYCQPLEFHQCVISGDPHYRTFDHFVHHFQGRAIYTLTRTLYRVPEALEPLSVAGSNWGPVPFRRVSFLREIYVAVYGYRITLMQGRQLVVNGEKVNPPFYSQDKLQVTQSGRSLLVQTDFGFSVSFDGRDYAEIVLPSVYRNYVGGLCGNYDGRQTNEYMMPNGKWTQSLSAFGNSWQLPSAALTLRKGPEAGGWPHARQEELAQEAESGFEAACSLEQLMLVNGTQLCGALSDPQGPFTACHGILSPSTFQESCVYDLCALFNDTQLLCQDYAAYAQLCQEEGVALGPWRQETGCEMSCPPHTTYRSCMTACPATCANMGAPSDCVAPCVEGCMSDPGYILSGLESVPYSQCGCTSNHRYYQINDTFLTGDCSQRCACQGPGTLVCEQTRCSAGLICAVGNYTRGCFRASACLSNPCLNQGTCEDLSGGFLCICPEGYVGLRCEGVMPDASSPPPPTSPTPPSPGNTEHLADILIGVLVPVGVILTVGAAFCIYRRRNTSLPNRKKIQEDHFAVFSAAVQRGDQITSIKKAAHF